MTPTLARSQQLQSQCLFNCSKHGAQRERLNGHLRRGTMVRIIVPHLQFQRMGPPIPHRVFWCHSFRRAFRSSVHPGPYDSNNSKKPAVAVDELQRAWDAKSTFHWTNRMCVCSFSEWDLQFLTEYCGAIRSGVLPGLVCIQMTPTIARSQQLQLLILHPERALDAKSKSEWTRRRGLMVSEDHSTPLAVLASGTSNSSQSILVPFVPACFPV